jgi:CxxC motif-containing protein
MADVMQALRDVRLNAPVTIGTVVLEDLFGSPVVVTKNIL